MAALMRVLIADDSSVTRRIVSEALNQENDMEVVGAAQDGEEAVAFFRAQRPDVVLLDVDMPTMSGIEALRTIRAMNDAVPVIMFSTLTVKGGEATLDALAAGATDYAPKPTGAGHLDKAMTYLKQEVVPKVRLWGNRYKTRQEKTALLTPTVRSQKEITVIPSSSATNQGTASSAATTSAATAGPARGTASFTVAAARPVSATAPAGTRKKSGPVSVLAIGASTGGPNALAELIGLLPGDLGVPVVIVQHMPPVFTQLLAERLDRTSRLTVREGIDGAVLKAGEVWVAPGDFHMTVVREGIDTVIRTNRNAPENSCRPAVDVLFRSVAEVYGGNSLAVVLTGMGRDGTAGCQVLSRCGAGILVQDEATSVVWGMPRSVAEAGLADSVLGLKDIAAAITTRIRGSQTSLSSLSASRLP